MHVKWWLLDKMAVHWFYGVKEKNCAEKMSIMHVVSEIFDGGVTSLCTPFLNELLSARENMRVVRWSRKCVKQILTIGVCGAVSAHRIVSAAAGGPFCQKQTVPAVFLPFSSSCITFCITNPPCSRPPLEGGNFSVFWAPSVHSR